MHALYMHDHRADDATAKLTSKAAEDILGGPPEPAVSAAAHAASDAPSARRRMQPPAEAAKQLADDALYERCHSRVAMIAAKAAFQATPLRYRLATFRHRGHHRTAQPQSGGRGPWCLQRLACGDNVEVMGRVAHVPYTVGQDEDGVWCAHVYVGRVGCNGYGDTREEALADLREAVVMVLEDDGAGKLPA